MKVLPEDMFRQVTQPAQQGSANATPGSGGYALLGLSLHPVLEL
ncbi:protein of unknown function [Cyanobium sp. NIES-981]|nr:protein of unknown function [Cyanobium sp. NIES-981]